MKYRKDRKGTDISILGYGCMRFTKNGGKTDIDKAEKEVMAAIALGVNYFDTAYIYPGNEVALGEILKRNDVREQIYIATKLPQYMIKTEESIEKLFQEELRRLQTTYVDYYLMHMLCDVAAWERLKNLHIVEWIEKKKASGEIRNIGFSYHGNSEMFCKLVDIYDWDFCQIQYNYLDEHSQAGRTGLLHASKKGIPVIIMEPLRGGRLVNMLPEKAKALIEKDPKRRTAAEIALRWLWDQSEVTCILSGMNSLEMVNENIRIAENSEPGMLTDEDFKLIEGIKEEISHTVKVGCTGCGYCLPCPKNVDIPGTFSCYNSMYGESKSSGRKDYFRSTLTRKTQSSASNCVNCGKCEEHCPQKIEIRKELKKAARELETPVYKVAGKIIKWFKLWG